MNKRDIFKLDLQRFGEAPEGDTSQSEEGVDTESSEGGEAKTYTQEELDAIVQSTADKRVTEGLKTAREKWEQELRAKRDEAEELAKLSTEERAAREIEAKESEIAKREAQIARKELELETINVLTEKKLPTTFSKFLLGADADETHQNIDVFSKAWAEGIEEAMKDKVKDSIYKKSAPGKASSFGKKLAQGAKQTKLEHNFY